MNSIGTRTDNPVKTKVKLSITFTPNLERFTSQEKLKKVEVQVDWTWMFLFKNILKVSHEVDLSKYIIQRVGLRKGKSSAMKQKIRDLLVDFKQVRDVYRVDVVPLKKSTKKKGPNTMQTTKRPLSSRNAARSRQTGRNVKRPDVPPPQVEFPPRFEEDVGAPQFLFDDDDNASQCTNATTGSLDELLLEKGIEKEDYKATVLHHIVNFVGNTQLILIREELKPLFADKELWNRMLARAPAALSYLKDTFSDN